MPSILRWRLVPATPNPGRPPNRLASELDLYELVDFARDGYDFDQLTSDSMRRRLVSLDADLPSRRWARLPISAPACSTGSVVVIHPDSHRVESKLELVAQKLGEYRGNSILMLDSPGSFPGWAVEGLLQTLGNARPHVAVQLSYESVSVGLRHVKARRPSPPSGVRGLLMPFCNPNHARANLPELQKLLRGKAFNTIQFRAHTMDGLQMLIAAFLRTCEQGAVVITMSAPENTRLSLLRSFESFCNRNLEPNVVPLHAYLRDHAQVGFEAWLHHARPVSGPGNLMAAIREEPFPAMANGRGVAARML